MKTEISVPDPVLEAAERLAKELGMSLSDLCVAALTTYIATHRNADVTKKLDEVYAKEKSSLEPGVLALQIASIGEQEGGPSPNNNDFPSAR